MHNCICSDDCYCFNVTCTSSLEIQNNKLKFVARSICIRTTNPTTKITIQIETRDALVKHVLENSFVWCYLGEFWILFYVVHQVSETCFAIHHATHNSEPFAHAREQLSTDSQNCAIQINSTQIYSPIFEFIIEIFFRIENVFSTHCCSLTAHDRKKEWEKKE